MKVVFLGTNGWYDSSTGNTICILVKTGAHNLILDAGNGIHKADRHLDDGKPTYLFLSHFHLDHIVGLHILAKFRFPHGLFICGQAGTREVLSRIINHPFSMPVPRLPFSTEVIEFPLDAAHLPFSVTALPLVHASPTIGYRFEMDGGVITYCPDTGYCDNAVELSRGADLLLAECAYLTGQQSESWPHLNPELAARIASEAGAARLGLVHFDAALYTTREARREAEVAAQAVFRNTFAAFDDMTVEVEARRP